MKSGLALYVVLSFGAIAAFGFFAMNTDVHDGLHCLGAIAQGMACPEDPVGFAAFHLAAFKIFSTAELPGIGLLQLILFAFLALLTASNLIGLSKQSYFTQEAAPHTLFIPFAPYTRWLVVRQREDAS